MRRHRLLLLKLQGVREAGGSKNMGCGGEDGYGKEVNREMMEGKKVLYGYCNSGRDVRIQVKVSL